MTESRAGHDLDLEPVLAFERHWENRPGNRAFTTASRNWLPGVSCVSDSSKPVS